MASIPTRFIEAEKNCSNFREGKFIVWVERNLYLTIRIEQSSNIVHLILKAG